MASNGFASELYPARTGILDGIALHIDSQTWLNLLASGIPLTAHSKLP